MHFAYELWNGNARADVEKYQWKTEADWCLLVGTEGFGRQTYWHQNVILLSTTKIICYKQYNKGHAGT